MLGIRGGYIKQKKCFYGQPFSKYFGRKSDINRI